MIISDRDPRIDPQRGDTVRGNGQVRCVTAREGDRVRCASGMAPTDDGVVNVRFEIQWPSVLQWRATFFIA